MMNQRGYIAISMVLIILSVVIAVATTVTLLAIGEAQSSLILTKGEDTLSFVEGCAEDALLKARASSSYTGGNITRPEGTCTVSVSKASTTWTLTISTTATAYVRTVEVVITRDGYGDTITTWKEI
jgi:uncharacterized protein (UPF0333 family)